VDENSRIEESRLQSYGFEVPLTLDETEWTRILGAEGLGCQLLEAMADLAAPHVEFDALDHIQQSSAEVLEFEVAGQHAAVQLDYEQPLTSTLLSAVRHVLDGVNHALKRARIPCRFAVARETCTGHKCNYRLMLAPTAWLGELDAAMNLVAGVTPEDYEMPMYAPRASLAPDFWEAR
jgi:hypothetical protein